MVGRATQRLDQERLGLPPVQHARPASRASRVETRLLGVESAADGDDAGGMKARNATHAPPRARPLPIRTSRSARSCPPTPPTPSRHSSRHHQPGIEASAAQTPSTLILSEAKDLPPPPSAQSHGRAAFPAPTAAVGPAGRLPCGARSAVAPHNSLRSLRSLRSNRRGESEVEARAFSARRPQPCAPRRRRVAAPAARPRLCETTHSALVERVAAHDSVQETAQVHPQSPWAHALHHARRTPDIYLRMV